jgi:hypothetical protein
MGTFISPPVSSGVGGMKFFGESLFVSFGHSPSSSLYQFSASTGAQVALLYDSFYSSNGPRTPCFGPDGSLYVPDWQSPNVKKFAATTYEYLGNFISLETISPASVAFAPDGSLLVLSDTMADPPEDAVLRFDSETGQLLGTLVSAGSGGLGRSTTILVAPNAGQ